VKVSVRLLSDLEEEILFRLTTCDSLASLALAGQVSLSMDRSIPLGVFHEAVLKLEQEGLVHSVKIMLRKSYSITQAGKTALQHEWNYYKALYEAREVKSA
jgi:hypothetical protein